MQTVMKSRSPFQPRQAMQIHNLAMSVASLVLLVFMLQEIVPSIQRLGFLASMCTTESWNEAYVLQVCLYDMVNEPRKIRVYRINYAFKYVELLDTVLLVLRKKRLRFLHVYHHASTIILCYVQLRDHSTVSWVAITANLFVHIFMYYYYFLAACGYRPSWRKQMTALQIIQFVVVGLTLIWAMGTSYFSRQGCSITLVAAVTGALILTSYFLLFVEFYFTAYIKRTTYPTLKAAVEAPNPFKGITRGD
ncbi:ELO family [Mycena crocata]|nr:ELO family [Mycena crocata]